MTVYVLQPPLVSFLVIVHAFLVETFEQLTVKAGSEVAAALIPMSKTVPVSNSLSMSLMSNVALSDEAVKSQVVFVIAMTRW